MKLMDAARGAALVALLALVAPAPASAQLGGFLKKQIKQKLVHTVVDSALNKIAGQRADSASEGKPDGDAAGAPVAPATSNAARRALASVLNQGPIHDDNMIQITPGVLDKLEKFLAAQKADPEGAARALREGKNVGPGGLTLVQYGLVTERVLFFCATARQSNPGSNALGALATAAGSYNAYTATEIAAIRPRCARIAALFDTADAQP